VVLASVQLRGLVVLHSGCADPPAGETTGRRAVTRSS